MRNIPEDNLAYPCLLEFNTWSSWSWFILNTWKECYLVTAKHVLMNGATFLWDSLRCIQPSWDINDDTKRIYDFNIQVALQDNLILLSENHDIAWIKIWDMEEKDWVLKIIYNSHVKITAEADSSPIVVKLETCIDINNVLISNDVYLYGYPSSIWIRKQPEFDYSSPLLRKGIVAWINKKSRTIILDCPVYYWNSWGPVVQVSHIKLWRIEHRIIWVVSKFIPFVEQWKNTKNGLVNTELSNSWYSVIVSIDCFLELIK